MFYGAVGRVGLWPLATGSAGDVLAYLLVWGESNPLVWGEDNFLIWD